MSKATLVIMAAGIGSRFGGGIKQLEPVGPGGEIIMDYSVYDALEAGFDKVVFVIRKDLEKDFKERIGRRIEKVTEVEYAFQEVGDMLPPYRGKFKDRTKPWGTGQAILCCKDVVDTPFLVINADDYYGKEAFVEGFQYLTDKPGRDNREICMVSFVLKNTLSDNGAVTRGVCTVDEHDMLTGITETHGIEKCGGMAFVRTEGQDTEIDLESAVSMNMWGLQPGFFQTLEQGFNDFLRYTDEDNLKAEFLLPTIIGNLLEDDRIAVKVLRTNDQWFGVTYKEDKEAVTAAVKELIHGGAYPVNLFKKREGKA